MDILILAHFCGDFSEGDNGRFFYLAKLLGSNHSVEIVTSDFFHIKKIHRNKLVREGPFEITFLHEPGYRKNLCLRRFYSHFIWGRNVKRYFKTRRKADVVYCAVPSLTAAYEAAKYCKKHGIKFIIDVQDLWPEAFRMVFDIPILSGLIFLPFTRLANNIYRKADEIVAVSQTYADRALAVNKKCQKGHVVFLGTEVKLFDKSAFENKVNIKKNGEIWLAYCGTLGSSYDITCVIDALTILKEKNVPSPKFVVMGDGPRKTEFENYAKEKQIDVWFVGRLPYTEMCGLLNACDIAVNPITHCAAQSIINKHADYAAAGLPVINTQECEEYRMLINEYQMGFNCRNNDAENVADKMVQLIQNENLRLNMGKNARRCADERFDRTNQYREITRLF